MREREGAVIYDDFHFNYREAAIGRDSYMQSAISRWMQTSAGVSKLHIKYGSFMIYTKCLVIKQSRFCVLEHVVQTNYCAIRKVHKLYVFKCRSDNDDLSVFICWK